MKKVIIYGRISTDEQKAQGQVNYGRRAWFAQRSEGEPGEPSLLGAGSAVYYPIPRNPRVVRAFMVYGQGGATTIPQEQLVLVR